MDSALIVSSSDKSFVYLTELLGAYAPSHVTMLKNGGEARRAMLEQEFDFVLINAPLSDEFGHELAILIAQETTAGVIMLVKSDLADEVGEKVEEFGVFVVPKPISRSYFHQTLKLTVAARNRLLGLKHENVLLQKKIEDIRLIDRAKIVLIQYLNMDEERAHRYIEKQAMDMRTTRAKIAQAILNTYES